MLSIFIVFIVAIFTGFGQFEHLKLSLIVEQMIWEIFKQLKSFSYGHKESRTGFISTQS